MHLLMCTQMNMHTLQLALCGGGGCGIQIDINTFPIIIVILYLFQGLYLSCNNYVKRLLLVATHLWYSSFKKCLDCLN